MPGIGNSFFLLLVTIAFPALWSFADDGVETPGAAQSRGTHFLGGAGMEGAYIGAFVAALNDAGIGNSRAVDADRWSSGMTGDVLNALFERHRDDQETDFSVFETAGHQFNLVGYSHGGLQASQAAADLAAQGGTVDNLVLISVPISREFLDALRRDANIKNVITINLEEYGDPIRPGMDMWALLGTLPRLTIDFMRGLYGNRTGHYYYAGFGEMESARQVELARRLFDAGLR